MTLASDQKLGSQDLSNVSRRMLELNEVIFAEWESRVRSTLEKAAELPQPVLINTLPAFYDNIAQSVTWEYPRSFATDGANLAVEHGGERARVAGYDYGTLVDEYQILRWVIFDVLYCEGVSLVPHEVLAINASVDAGIKEGVAGFAAAERDSREQFAAALTHDLRGPLATAATALELVLTVNDLAKARTFAAKALENVHRVSSMTNELLHTMAYHSGDQLPLQLSNFDIRELAKEVQIESNVSTDRIVIFDDTPVIGWWDRPAMRRALENLLSNAVKYGHSDTLISIRAVAKYGRLMLSVHNQGPEIPQEEVENIFQIFKRVKNSQTIRQQGWGIGLAYVRAVAESHRGSIILDSTAERGTTFTIDVPVDCRSLLT